MAPRKYSMDKRRAAVQETRQRILEATLALHTEKGIFGTSWQDIAKRADVSVGTVYKHFPSLDELVPACGELMYAITRPPSLEDAPEIFAEANSLDERLRRLVEELFAFYERGASYIETDFQERRLPAVVEWEAYMRATIAGLVREALVSAGPDEHTVQSVARSWTFLPSSPSWIGTSRRSGPRRPSTRSSSVGSSARGVMGSA